MTKKYRYKESELGVFTVVDDIIEKLQPRSRILGLTRGQFSLIDLIYNILEKTGPADVITCTWSAGIKDVNQIRYLIDNKNILSYLIITDHSFASRKNQYLVDIESLFGKENIRTSEIHAKFTLIRNKDWNICIRHSMNLNANRTCESFEIDDDAEICDFYHDFVRHTFQNTDPGFVRESWKVERNLDRFFEKKQQNNSWSELVF